MMDWSHILAGGLTITAIVLLISMEIHSRRNSAAQQQIAIAELSGEEALQQPRGHANRKRE